MKQRRLLFERPFFMLKTQNSPLISPSENGLQRLGSRKHFSLLQKDSSNDTHTRTRSHSTTPLPGAGGGRRTYLQVNLLHAGHIVRDPPEEQPPDAGGDADAHEQHLFVVLFLEPLVHVFHLQPREKEATLNMVGKLDTV